MLRRMILAAALVALVALALESTSIASTGQRPRKVEARYVIPTPGFYALCVEGYPGFGCVRITPREGERFIHVELRDASGTKTQGFVNQDANDDGSSDIDGLICGRTEAPLKVEPEVPILIFVLAHQSDCPDSVGTTGTVVATFGKTAKEVAQATR